MGGADMTKPITSGVTVREQRIVDPGVRPDAKRPSEVDSDAFVTGKPPVLESAQTRRPSGVTSQQSGRIDGVPASGPSDALEAPKAELAALVDSSTGIPASRRGWSQLSEAERAGAAALGFEVRSWDRARAGDEG